MAAGWLRRADAGRRPIQQGKASPTAAAPAIPELDGSFNATALVFANGYPLAIITLCSGVTSADSEPSAPQFPDRVHPPVAHETGFYLRTSTGLLCLSLYVQRQWILMRLRLRTTGADAYSAPGVASYQAPPHTLAIQSPPSNGNRSHPATAPAQLSAGFAPELRSPRQLSHPNYMRPRGPVPRFRRLHTTDDLDPKINAQPPFRRANPEGGFISVSFLAPTVQRDGGTLTTEGSLCNH